MSRCRILAMATVSLSATVWAYACGDGATEPTPDPSRPTAENPDRAALVAFYRATDGPNWVNSENWLTDAPLGEWYGVDTGATGRVVRLDLHENDLKGPIPPELGNLDRLESLVLSSNELFGEIPPELGDLGRLGSLSLRWNDLSGRIPPELGDLANLRRLFLASNSLSGPLPQSFLQLGRLTVLAVGWNPRLCLPGSSFFLTWYERVAASPRGPLSHCNADDIVVLNALYETAGGTAWTESRGWLGQGSVEEWYGIRADSLGRVVALDLAGNGLRGQLPGALGTLAAMTRLRIGRNDLSGRLPASLTRLSLVEFHYDDTELCAPTDASFQAWLNGVPSHEGTGVECAPLSERDILGAIYETTGGSTWTNSRGWLTDASIGDWYGVQVDGEGSVVRLELRQNNLRGTMPAELGDLASLTRLDLADNGISGPIPPELGNLGNLEWLSLSSNALSGPIPAELGNLGRLVRLSLSSNALSGPIPPELGNLGRLESLILSSNALSGPIPAELGGLASLAQLALARNDLSGPIPPELGNLGRLESLILFSNALSGPIPAELGNLGRLESLILSSNALSGPIPAELGNLGRLESLILSSNALSDPIPAELGDLASLTQLVLAGNYLSGPMPAELADLASLTRLDLAVNGISGPIPPELGNLGRLESLSLSSNALSGPIPPRLGDLSMLERLLLDNNTLTGALAPELGGMSSLQELSVMNNPGLVGALPARLRDLRQLEVLLTQGTQLCVPSDPGLQAWLEGVYRRRIPPCTAADEPTAYLTQAVQSREYPVPLVAGDKAMLRVFPTANQATSQVIPAVRARFFVNDREVHVENIPGKSTAIPTTVDEGSLEKSVNAEIPAEVIQPGLEVVIEVDPDQTLDPGLGIVTRIPESGRLAVDVRAMPVFDVTLIPFVWSERHDSSTVNVIEAMVSDPENHESLWYTRTLLPVGELELTPHEPVLTSTNNVFALLGETEAIRILEGGTGHYLGMVPEPVTGASGAGFVPGRSTVLVPTSLAPTSMAHEFGHNMGLPHAPCPRTIAGRDPSFPHPNGSIGAWGYDFRGGGRLVDPSINELMSYCFSEPSRWISDYYFTNSLRYRLFDEGAAANAAIAAPTRSLLLWGGVGANSVPYLEPAVVVDAATVLPDSAGAFRLTGRASDAAELFSLSFNMPETAHGNGNSSFAFVLPVMPGWEGQLATITLTGPGGSFTLDADSDLPTAILRDPRNGQIRGILRDPPPATRAAANAAAGRAASLEVLFSRGLPDAEAWRR